MAKPRSIGMTTTQFRRDNHYVARVYLRRWASSAGQVWTYRTLVPHAKASLWKLNSIRGVAYHSHLYTKIIGGQESDEFEHWLANEFESPVEDSLRKATTNRRMTPDDWTRLVRFVAAQDVRTPARFEEQMKRWRATLPQMMKETIQDGVRELETLKGHGQPIPHLSPSHSEGLPLKISVHKRQPGEESGHIKAEVVIGRSFWLWHMKHLLEETAQVLHQHRWTILRAPEGMSWPTSDNPVIRLNFNNFTDYDFGGGWGSPGTEIFLPIGPQHLLFTQIGKRPPLRGEIMPAHQASIVRRFIAEHAHRMIFAATQDAEIPRLRPRTADANLCQHERDQWATWHQQQTESHGALDNDSPLS